MPTDKGKTGVKQKVLFVDDERMLLDVFERLFTRHGLQVTTCASAIQAVDALKKETYDLVVTDFLMPDMDGLELLAHIRQEYPETGVMMITAHANVQHAVQTMQTGAIDYLPKPFSTDQLVERVLKYLESAKTEEKKPRETRGRRGSRQDKQPKADFVGEHPTIKQLKELLPRISRNKAPVFIRGESGTGKEILARLIHHISDRPDGNFVALNCANLPKELVESHLFGHRKGAFTGAIEDMTGAFERADGGTLLLDEITEVDLPVQAKLLRVLQEQEFQKVGSTETKKIDVRVIATSNRDLHEAIGSGIFREDLYHRLSVFPLSVPPLRERASDIPTLAEHFVEKYCTLYGLPPKKLEPRLMSYFRSFPWPGNVRQLENMIQRGVILSAEREIIETEDILNDFFADTEEVDSPSGGAQTGHLRTIDDMERHMILKALDETGNNQQLAADQLGISARTIRNKLRKYRSEGTLPD